MKIIRNNNIFRFTCNNNCRCHFQTCECRKPLQVPKKNVTKLTLGKYNLNQSGVKKKNSNNNNDNNIIDNVELSKTRPKNIRGNKYIGVYTEKIIKPGEHIIELVGQIVDDIYMAQNPIDEKNMDEDNLYGFNIQKCCDISRWKDPSDFIVYDNDDEDEEETDDSDDSSDDDSSEEESSS